MMSPLRILVVDDNRSAADPLAKLLRKTGDEVEACYDGATAIDFIQKSPPDVVLTDLKMEPVDGLAVLQAARAQRPPVEVIVFTAYGAVEVAVRAMRMGARDFLTKPVTVDQVTKRLDDMRTVDVVPDDPDFAFIARSRASQEFENQLRRASKTSAPVWLEGEIGSGRGHAARFLHLQGKNPDAPFRVIDVGRMTGWPESGTVVLPNVGDLPEDLQLQLYRQLTQLPDNVRVIATSGPSGKQQITEGTLRPELYYQLAVIVVRVPPLRERREDVLPLLHAALEALAKRYDGKVPNLSSEQEASLQAHSWPGNIRELQNLAERAIVMGGDALDFEPVSGGHGLPLFEPGFSLSTYLEAVEKRILVEALRRTAGDRNAAGKLLGVERNTLRYKLNKYGLLDR